MAQGETILHRRSIAGLAGAPDTPGHCPVRHVHSLGPMRVSVPPLPTGGFFFNLWPVRELPAQGLWAAPHYDSFAPPVFVLHNALVHGAPGILGIGDAVVEESLVNTAPSLHFYRHLPRAVALRTESVEPLAGVHISLLAGGEMDYRHAVLGGLARLMAVPDNIVAAATSLLVPRGGAGQRALLHLLDLLPTLRIREVAPGETLAVETLVYPLSVAGEAEYHPCIGDFFRRVSSNLPPGGGRLPRHVYLDRSGSGIRPLRNEATLMAALRERGIEPVRIDQMSVPDQIRLFRQAETIVAPNGSPLTNLGFARPGCLVIELMMDACVDWSFRHLAALMDLRYDCVLGRATRPWPELDGSFNQTEWEISPQHVIAAVMHGQDVAARAA